MEQTAEAIADVMDDLLHKKNLLLAKSLMIPFFVFKGEMCNKASIKKRQANIDQLIKNILVEKFGNAVSFSKDRAYHKYRDKMRRGLFVYGIDLIYESDETKLYTNQDVKEQSSIEHFCQTHFVFEPGRLCPGVVICEHLQAYNTKQRCSFRPVDIKTYLLQTPNVSLMVHKRRKYKGVFYYGNFYVGIDVK